MPDVESALSTHNDFTRAEAESLEVISGREAGRPGPAHAQPHAHFKFGGVKLAGIPRAPTSTVRNGSQNRVNQKAYDVRITAVCFSAKTVQRVVRSVGKQHENWVVGSRPQFSET
eukprot:1143339-Pelagomonas_calceolata.AAC.1